MRLYFTKYKSQFLTLAFAVFTLVANAQANFITNGGFEDYSACPTGLNQLNNAKGWFNPLASDSSSPDYFNSCSKQASVPANVYGYQSARNGNAYAGIYLLDFRAGNAHDPYREYVACRLNARLVCGRLYRLSYYLALAQRGLTTSSIQALFSDSYINISKRNMVGLKPQLYNSYYNTLNDTGVWVQVQADFTASGNEEYVYIGNFNLDNTGNTQLIDSKQLTHCYVYLDDVSLYAVNGDACDTALKLTTAILPTAFTPNYDNLNDAWHLLGNTAFSTIDLKVYDRWGQIIYKTDDPHFSWNGTKNDKPMPQGTYKWTITYQLEGNKDIYSNKGEVNIIR